MNIIKCILFHKPAKIKLGQIWWDNDGHFSECNSNKIYITLGKDRDDYWTCAGLSYWGSDERFLGGCNSRGQGGIEYYLLDKELFSMMFVGYMPSWKIKMTKILRRKDNG